jgi:TolB-like protein
MPFLASLRERRIIPFLGSYVVAGFLVLEAVDQLVGHGLVPEVLYSVTLIFYALGIPATAVVAWFHGAKGAQRMPRAERWLLTIIAFVTIGASGIVVRNYIESAKLAELAASSELDARRIAVLYFDDLSPNQNLTYLTDGFTEALISNLAQVRELDVVSRNGSAQYRDSDLSVDSIARALQVGSVIRGAVEESGDRLRVSLRLIDGASGVDLERTSFEIPRDQLLQARDSVAGEASRLLRKGLGKEVRLREQRASTANVTAWELVQQAERERKIAETHIADGDAEAAFAAYDRADTLFALASAQDPNWLDPVVGRGEIAYRLSRFAASPEEAIPEIQTSLGFAAHALETDPNSAAALELRGTVRYWAWIIHAEPDPVKHEELLKNAQADLERATELDPTRASAYSTLSHLYYQTDDVPAAVIAARRAYEEDAYLAVAPEILWRLSVGSYDLAQFAAAKRWCEVGAQRFPDDYRFAFCQLTVMATPAGEPDIDRAWELLDELQRLSPEHRRDFDTHRGRIFVAAIIGLAGLPDSARSVLDRNRQTIDHEVDPDGELLVVEAYARATLGDADDAIDLLKLYAAAEHGFARGANLHWWWQELSTHPRWSEVETAGE